MVGDDAWQQACTLCPCSFQAVPELEVVEIVVTVHSRLVIVHCRLAQCLELFHVSQCGLVQLTLTLASVACHHLALRGMERMAVAALLVPTARLEECGWSRPLGRKHCTYVEQFVGWAVELGLPAEPHVAPAAQLAVVVQLPDAYGLLHALLLDAAPAQLAALLAPPAVLAASQPE